MSDKRLRGLDSLIEQSQEQGIFSLPAEVLNAHEVFKSLAAARIQATTERMELANRPYQLETERVSEIVAKLGAGKKRNLLDVSMIRAAEQEAEDSVLREKLIDRACDLARQELLDAVVNTGSAIIVDHLRPEFEGIIAEAAGLAPALEGVQSAEEALRKESIRIAWLELTHLYEKYLVIRRAWNLVITLSGMDPWGDDSSYFSEFRDAQDHIPRAHDTRNLTMGTKSPIPEAGPARLAYIATKTEAWLPTLAERQARQAELIEANPLRPARVS